MQPILLIRGGRGLNKSARIPLHLFDKLARGCPAHSLHLASQVRLVGVACVQSQVCQAALAWLSSQPEEALKTKHAIQRLESVTKRIDAPAPQGSLAYTQAGGEPIQPQSSRTAIVAGRSAQQCDLPVCSPNLAQPAQQHLLQCGCNLRCALTG